MEPATSYNEHDDSSPYWINGKVVYWKQYPVKVADAASFRHFPGSWAKDHKRYYWGSTQLKGADMASFEALNFTYAKDKTYAWTLAGRIATVDAASFAVCDSGKLSLGTYKKNSNGQLIDCKLFAPYGYAKDKNKVYYYDFRGQAKIVAKATPSSFVSLDDGHFGYDETHVFCGTFLLPKAKPQSWQKLELHYYYSRYGETIYYLNRPIPGADAATFEIATASVNHQPPIQLAKDKNHQYWNDARCSKDRFDELISKYQKM